MQVERTRDVSEGLDRGTTGSGPAIDFADRQNTLRKLNSEAPAANAALEKQGFLPTLSIFGNDGAGPSQETSTESANRSTENPPPAGPRTRGIEGPAGPAGSSQDSDNRSTNDANRDIQPPGPLGDGAQTQRDGSGRLNREFSPEMKQRNGQDAVNGAGSDDRNSPNTGTDGGLNNAPPPPEAAPAAAPPTESGPSREAPGPAKDNTAPVTPPPATTETPSSSVPGAVDNATPDAEFDLKRRFRSSNS